MAPGACREQVEMFLGWISRGGSKRMVAVSMAREMLVTCNLPQNLALHGTTYSKTRTRLI